VLDVVVDLVLEEAELGALQEPENRLTALPRIGRVARLRDEVLLDRVEQAVVVVLALAQLQEV
jgi:hypothetical protein